jgi:hypothetical protein
MKFCPHKKWRLLAATFLLLLARENGAQQLPVGHATDFISNNYFEPPNEQRVKMRLSGAEALPLPGGLLDVKRLTVETFALDGKTEMVVHAPQCNYAPLDGVANSAGHLELDTGDRRLHVTGEGFLWQQAESHLIISNQVKTIINMPAVTVNGL